MINEKRIKKVDNRYLKEQLRKGMKHLKKEISVEEPENIKKYINTIINGDSEQVLKKIPSNSIDLIITSPPYNFGLSYDDDDTEDTKEWTEYFSKLNNIWKECYRILKPGGRIAINVQPLFSDYIPTHHIISNQLMNMGLLWKAEILWEKNNYNAKYTAWGSWKSPSMPYLKYTWEFIEVFCKETHKKVGSKELIDIEKEEFKEWVYAKWSIAPERRMKDFGHPAMFPEELPKRLMKLFSYKGDIVLDPFNGVGTTSLVAYRLKRRFIGIDISKKYCEIAINRINEDIKQKTIDDILNNKLPFEYPNPKLISYI
jgi:site-specific DNA-methyltransferase (adenine-specific)